MAANTLAMRRVILTSLFEHLKLNYDFEPPADPFLSGQITDHEIDIVLSYKTDQRIEELREALARVARGTYGFCLRCKKSLNRAALQHDPTKRICSACEAEFNMSYQSPLTSHVEAVHR